MWNGTADFKFAFRMASKNPWMSAAAVVALGAGMAVAIGGFSLIWDTRYATLPFENSERIVAVRDIGRPDPADLPPTLAVFREWQRTQTTFDVLGAAYARDRDIADGDGGLVRHYVASMTASGFDVTGAPPLYGRTLNIGDQQPGAPAVVVLGYGVWRSLLGADPRAVGATLRVDGTDRLIVGVMPEGFKFPIDEDLWIPMDTNPIAGGGVEPRWLRVFGRLSADTSVQQAEAELDAIRQGYADRHPEDIDAGERRTTVLPYVQSDSEPGADVLFLGMFIFLVLILVVACASVSNLLLARATARTGEIAVRAALGASRRRLVTQMFIEALLLTSAGAALGTLTAHLGLRWFESAATLRIPFWLDFGVNPAAVAFAAIAAFGAAAIAGIVPAYKATGAGMHEVLKDGQGTSSGIRFGKISAALTIAEVTLSVAFLAAAGLAAQSLVVGGDLGDGLNAEHVLVATVRMVDEVQRVSADDGSTEVRVPDDAIPVAQWRVLQEDIRRALRNLPGVEATALAQTVPGQQHRQTRVEVEATALDSAPTSGTRVSYAVVSPEFLGAFGVEIVAGRNFGPLDTAGAEPVALVNEAFARRFFGARTPVGKRFRQLTGSEASGWYRIVGVVPNLRMNPANDVVEAGLYLPFSQDDRNRFTVALHVDGNPLALSAAVKDTIKAIDARIDVAEFRTLDELAAGFLVVFQMMSMIFVGIGGMALFLALAGLYAVMAFSVTRRTREIGIRMALGADRRRVMGVVLRRGLLQVGIGVALGTVGGGALLQLMSLFPVGAASGGAGLLVAAAAAMLFAGLLACLVPAARALAIHPLEALRHE